MRRRRFVAAAVLTPAAALAARGRVAAGCVNAILAALEAAPPGPVLLHSYRVAPGGGDFDLTQANAAYVYDNALAGLALAAAGHAEAAARIGEALAIAQAHDRFWRDGRLRNAYQAGAMTVPAKLPGWWDAQSAAWREDPYQAGSQTGPVAWAMLLWAALGNVAAANRAGDWLNRVLRAQDGYFGGFHGFEPAPVKLGWRSTEQNTDLFAAFTRLRRGGDAAHAAAFVRSMRDPRDDRFAAGTAPDGARNALLAADAGIWPYLAGLADAGSAAAAIAELRRGDGIGFSAVSQGVWTEGTAFAALALRRQKNPLASAFQQAAERRVGAGGMLDAADADELATGFAVGPPPASGAPQPFRYFHRPALAPTAWAALSRMDVNPLQT